MTQIQQQRLMGAVLLICLIGVVAYIVLSKVGENQVDKQLTLPEPIEFSSIIEPLDEVTDQTETMVDADLLNDQTATTVPPEQTEDKPAQQSKESSTQQAVKPEVASLPTSPSTTPKADATAPTTAKTETPPISQPIAVKPNETAKAPESKLRQTDTKQSGSAWIVQIGSFSVQKNADELKAKLEQLNYKPYMERTSSGSETLYRVRLPASQNRSELETISARIRQQLNITPQIITQ